MRIALIAHDKMKAEMIAFAIKHKDVLKNMNYSQLVQPVIESLKQPV